MAIMFRQKLRRGGTSSSSAAPRGEHHPLADHPRHRPARPRGSEKYSPVWDFVMFIIDNAGEERDLDRRRGALPGRPFQLHICAARGRSTATSCASSTRAIRPPGRSPGTEFLGADRTWRISPAVLELGQRFGSEPRLQPLREFAERKAARNAS